MDLVRSVLNRFLFITIQGMTFPTWARLLWEIRLNVHPFHWPRALILTVTSLLNALCAALDALLFGWRVRQVRVEAPWIILGHFRSGTTHLHNMLAIDRSFAYPTLYQTMNPHSFLSTEAIFGRSARLLWMRHRPQDNVAIDPTVPAEDEFAVAIATGMSPYMGLVFPRSRTGYERYLTFEGVPERQVRALEGRPAVVSSEAHLEIRPPAHPQVASPHSPDQVASGAVPRCPRRTHPPAPVRGLLVRPPAAHEAPPVLRPATPRRPRLGRADFRRL
jgi:hypothetical protein